MHTVKSSTAGIEEHVRVTLFDSEQTIKLLWIVGKGWDYVQWYEIKLTFCHFCLIMYWSTAKMSSNNLLLGAFLSKYWSV